MFRPRYKMDRRRKRIQHRVKRGETNACHSQNTTHYLRGMFCLYMGHIPIDAFRISKFGLPCGNTVTVTLMLGPPQIPTPAHADPLLYWHVGLSGLVF